ncbi:MAG TPA: hypothetical protein VLJ57_11355 [Burkholderiaceae bacterium]|nr:hypothetical protein [Burkholderiaceae bacterium]
MENITDEELASMAVQIGMAVEGVPIPPEYRAFANLVAHRCAEIADRRDPSVRPGAAIRGAFGLKDRRKVGRPRERNEGKQ